MTRASAVRKLKRVAEEVGGTAAAVEKLEEKEPQGLPAEFDLTPLECSELKTVQSLKVIAQQQAVIAQQQMQIHEGAWRAAQDKWSSKVGTRVGLLPEAVERYSFNMDNGKATRLPQQPTPPQEAPAA